MKRAVTALLALLLTTSAWADTVELFEGAGFSLYKDRQARCLFGQGVDLPPAHILCQNGSLYWESDALQWWQSVNYVWTQIDFDGGAPDFPLLAPNGTQAAPSYSFTNAASSGLWYNTASTNINLKGKDGSGTNGAGERVFITGGPGTGTGNGGTVFLQVAPPDSSSGSTANALQTGLSISGINGTINLGGIDVETLTAGSSFFDGASVASGMTDGAGGSLSLRTGQSTGSGLGGTFLGQITPAGSSGTSQNSYQSFISVTAAGVFDLGGLDIIGAPGASTWGGSERASGVTDGTGGDLTIRSGRGTGAAAASSISFETPTVGGSGSSQQSLATRFTVATAASTFTNKVKITGTAPTVSSCGTGPTITGSDQAGKVTTGSGGTVQSCTLTFSSAFTAAPACVANDETGIVAVRATSTTTTLVIDCAVAGCLETEVVSYICMQGS